MENEKRLSPEFGRRYNFAENIHIEYDGLTGNIVNEIVVKMVEKYDGFVADQIAMEAKASGVSDLTVLNKAAIMNAINKQIPQQVILNEIECLCPSCRYDMMGLPGCSRPQLLSDMWSKIEMEDERWQITEG